MNAILKTLIAAGIAASLSFNAQAADIAPATHSVQEHIQRLERMKDMTPEQRAQERKAMREGVRKLTPEQRAERRKARQKEFVSMLGLAALGGVLAGLPGLGPRLPMALIALLFAVCMGLVLLSGRFEGRREKG